WPSGATSTPRTTIRRRSSSSSRAASGSNPCRACAPAPATSPTHSTWRRKEALPPSDQPASSDRSKDMQGGDADRSSARSYLYYRHSLPVRLMHWTNVVALTILLMSGLQIFNAHPNLYWSGKSSYTGAPPVLAIGARQSPESGIIGTTRIFGHEFNTTGVLGVSRSPDGELSARAFPWWMTIPDNPWLAMARAWHLFFAWVLLING